MPNNSFSTSDPTTSTFKPEEKLYAEVPDYELKFTDHHGHHGNMETSTNHIPEMPDHVEETTRFDEISTEQNQTNETSTEFLYDISNSTELNSAKNNTSNSESSSDRNKEDLVLKDLGNEQKLMMSDIKNVEFKIQNFEHEETTRKLNNDFDVPTTTEKDYNSTSDHK